MDGLVNNPTVDKLVKAFEDLFKSLPPIPVSSREALVSFLPWLALVFGILGVAVSLGGVLALVGLGALGTALMPFGGAALLSTSIVGAVGSVVWLVSSVLMLLSYPGLKARKMIGWRYAFVSEVVGVVAMVLGLNLVGLVLTVVAFYLLFQVKSHYK